MNVGQLVGGIALGVGAGVASGIAMNKVMFDRANVSPEVRHERASGDPDADGIIEVTPWVMGAFGAVGAGVGGVHALSNGWPAAAGIGLLGTAGVLAGGFVGGLIGAARGGRAAHETFDPTITQDVDKLMARYDTDKDGELSLAAPSGVMPEFMYRNEYEPNPYTGTTGINSIEAIAKRADGDSNEIATRQELIDLYTSFDASGNDKLNGEESGDMIRQGLYERM